MLGMPLFSRRGRHFPAWPGGEAVVRRARDILGDIEGIRERARQTLDADVIKSCVRLNMGSGINAMALAPKRDGDLLMTPRSCFRALTTQVHFHRRTLALPIQREFIRHLLPHLSDARLTASAHPASAATARARAGY